MLTEPVPELRVYRNLPSPLAARSRLVGPAGSELRIAPAMGVSAPLEPTEKPATVEVAVIDDHRPEGPIRMDGEGVDM